MRQIKTCLLACLLTFAGMVMAQEQNQNKYEESIPYTEWNNEMLVPVMIGNQNYTFILGLHGNTTLLTDHLAAMGVENQVLPALNIGRTLFADRIRVSIEDNAQWRANRIAGRVGEDVWRNYVVTINRRSKTIILSTPFKPAFVDLRNRVMLHDKLQFNLAVTADLTLPVQVDLTGTAFLYASPTAWRKLSPLLKDGVLPAIRFVKKAFTNQTVVEKPSLSVSRLGSAVLDAGLLSIDYPKNRMYFQPYDEVKADLLNKPHATVSHEAAHGNLIPIDRVQFNTQVFNYRAGKKWDYLGDQPAIIDFWATWCAPCKKMLPTIEKLADKYAGRIRFYKLNVDEEKEIAKYYDIVSIPVLMFIPTKGKPVPVLGLQTEEEIEAQIKRLLNQ